MAMIAASHRASLAARRVGASKHVMPSVARRSVRAAADKDPSAGPIKPSKPLADREKLVGAGAEREPESQINLNPASSIVNKFFGSPSDPSEADPAKVQGQESFKEPEQPSPGGYQTGEPQTDRGSARQREPKSEARQSEPRSE